MATLWPHSWPNPQTAIDTECVSAANIYSPTAPAESRSSIGLDTLRLVLDTGAPYSIHTNQAHMRNVRSCNETYRGSAASS